jgi:hypothetical protein
MQHAPRQAARESSQAGRAPKLCLVRIMCVINTRHNLHPVGPPGLTLCQWTGVVMSNRYVK